MALCEALLKAIHDAGGIQPKLDTARRLGQTPTFSLEIQPLVIHLLTRTG
jgi:hypothetical protein